MQRELNAIISQKIIITPDLMILRIIPEGWELPEFLPGQYAVIGLPGSAERVAMSDPEEEPANPEKVILRAYSIASSSIHKEYLELYIAMVRSGALTPRLFALNPGDKLHLAPKIKGVFTLDELSEDTNVVMIGTGTGLAPYMSMLRTSLTPGSTRKFAVIHGARHSWDLGYRSELNTISNMSDRFVYIPVVSRPGQEVTQWGGAEGHVQQLWHSDHIEKGWGFKPTPDNTHIFLCGNPSMITAAVEILEADKFVVHSKKQPGQIHLEKYW